MRYGLYILLLLHIALYVKADELDSLRARLDEITGDSEIEIREKVDILNTIGYLDWFTQTENLWHNRILSDSVYKLKLNYSNKALHLSENLHYIEGKAKALQNVGFIYYYMGEIDSAILLSEESLELYKSLDDKTGIGITCMNICFICWHSGVDANKSIIYGGRAFQTFVEINDYDRACLIYDCMGYINRNFKLYESALVYFHFTLPLRLKNGKHIETAGTLNLTGDVFYDLQKYDSALYYYREALKYAEKSNEKVSNNIVGYWGNIHSFTLQNIGKTYQAIGDQKLALNFFLQALKEPDEKKDLLNVMELTLLLGEYYTRTGEYDLAKEYINKSFDAANKLNLPGDPERLIKLKINIYRNLADIKLIYGQYKEAFKYFKTYATIEDSLFHSDYENQRAEFQILYNMELKEIQNEILKKDNTIQQLKLEKQKLNQQLLLLLLILTVIGLSVYIYRYKLKIRINRQLKEDIKKAIENQQKQQQIIVHQSGLTSLGEMATGIAQEIGRPMNDLSEALDRIDHHTKLKKTSEPVINDMVAIIHTGLKKMNLIVNHIQNFTSKQKSEIYEKFNINTVIRNALSMVKTQYENHLINLKTALDNNLPEIRGNPYKLEQVIVNLLNNARDAVEERAKIENQDFRKKITLTTIQSKQKIIIEVKDNGIGIPEKDYLNIFKPFYTTKELGKGTGLGLSISQAIIEEFNGTINVYPGEMGSAKFRITIPMNHN